MAVSFQEDRGTGMTTLRDIHRYMNEKRFVSLTDGRIGKIVRVDTFFPDNDTTVRVWTTDDAQPNVVKVRLAEVLGPAKLAGQ